MAAIEEPVTCLNLCRHPVTGTLGIVFHTFFHTTESATHVSINPGVEVLKLYTHRMAFITFEG